MDVSYVGTKISVLLSSMRGLEKANYSCGVVIVKRKTPVLKAVSINLKADAWSKNSARQKVLAIQDRLKTRTKPLKPSKYRQGWRKVGDRDIFFRSRWEANYGFYLEWLKNTGYIESWEHEPKTFWFEGIKRGIVSYLPDFKIIFHDGSHEWHEVKGHMDSRSRTKIKRFKKYFPKEIHKVFGAAWFKKNTSKNAKFVPGWEK